MRSKKLTWLLTGVMVIVGIGAIGHNFMGSKAETHNKPADMPLAEINKGRETKVAISNVQMNSKQRAFVKPYAYNKKKQFKSLPLDYLGRAQGSHIQLNESQTPKENRSQYLTINPSGWHNYKFKAYKNGKAKTTWLFNRGHLVGYQFCGLNNYKPNLITQTMYLNQGSLTGMNQYNQAAQLFYEEKLRSWLMTHPKDRLDYSVVPLYHSKELVPRKVQLMYVGYNNKGKKIRIRFKTVYEKDDKGVTKVILNNVSPQAAINYQTGRAKVKSVN